MKKTDGSIDLKNITQFVKEKKLPEAIVCMEQIHVGNIALISDANQKVIPGVDGLITKTKNINLGIVTADCLPILFYDSKKNVIGAVHAGRKGLFQKIIHNCVEKFKTEFKSNPEDIQVSIGPGIEKNCYEVGSDLIEQFENEFEWFDNSFWSTSNANRYLLDLRKIALQSLIKEGILREHIEISELCTKCEVSSLYSYRGGDKTGRFVSVIQLV
jgi:YfiH family protein